MTAVYTPELTREDQRSLAYHRAIVEHLRKDPLTTIHRAKGNLKKLSRIHRGRNTLFKRWEKWLKLNTDELITKILALDLEAREMRQVSPFSGILGPADRVRILRQFRMEYKS